MTAKPVSEHTTIVSINTSKAPISPCLIGWSVLAEACTIGEVPQPASLEYTNLANPNLIAVATLAPTKPPDAMAVATPDMLDTPMVPPIAIEMA